MMRTLNIALSWPASRVAAGYRRRLAIVLLGALLAPAAPIAAQNTLTLHDAIALAQNHGRAARAARSTLDAARWRQRAFSARNLPQLSLDGAPRVNRAIAPVIQPDGTTQFVPQSEMQSTLNLTLSQRITATGGEMFVSSGLLRVDRFGQESSRLWQSTPLMVGLRQDIFRPNALAWDGREQSLRTEIAERQAVEALEDVAIATASAFFDLYSARMALHNATANVAVNDTLYTLSKGRYEVGKIGENDLLQSELALLRARTTLDGARLDHDRALAALKLLIDLPQGAELDIMAPVEIPVVALDTARAVAEALRNRSQMRDLDLQAVQARRRIDEARLNTGFGATVTASAGLNQTAPVFGDAYRSLLDQQRLAVTVQMPLVQWGGRRAQFEAARADQNRLTETSQTSRESTAQEAHFAALQVAQSERQLVLSAKADTVAAKRFEVAKNRYVIGKIGIGDLYIAQSEKDAALQSYVQALRGYWLAYHRLRRITLYDFTAGQEIRAAR